MNQNDTMLRRVIAYGSELDKRYLLYLNVVFPEVNGKRQPLMTEGIDKRNQFLLLREVARHAKLVQEGQAEPTFQTEAFTENRDNAQERLAELAIEFGEKR